MVFHNLTLLVFYVKFDQIWCWRGIRLTAGNNMEGNDDDNDGNDENNCAVASNEEAKICFFCGDYDLTLFKAIPHADIQKILDMQRSAGIKEPILTFCQNLIQEILKHIYKQKQEQQKVQVNNDADDLENFVPFIHCCMCCYHWIARRQDVEIVPLPMQNLLWFTVTLEWCEGGKSKQRCDKRVLQRMIKALAKPHNIYRSLFSARELEHFEQFDSENQDFELEDFDKVDKLERVEHAEEPDNINNLHTIDNTIQSDHNQDKKTCVKRHITSLFIQQNGNGLLLPHTQASFLFRH